MTDSPTLSADRKTFTFSVNGRQQLYTNDKEGKRQAILDGLNAIPTITAAEDTCLPDDAALQVVAAVLYPDGIETEKAYDLARRTAEKACAHLGYGEAVQLGPPLVPFAQRGSYRRKRPPLDPRFVLDELELAGTSSTYPRQEMIHTVLWNKAGIEVYGKRWRDLSPAEQQSIEAQVDEIAQQAGWSRNDNSYFRPLPVDEAAVRSRIGELLRQAKGHPVSVGSVVYQAQLGAYGRGFYANELAPALQTIVAQTLQANNYRPAPEEGEYRPLPVTITETEAGIREKLAGISPVMTQFGPALMLRDVLESVTEDNWNVSTWQAEQLLKDSPVGQLLRQMGYQTETAWLQPYQFRPQKPDHDDARQVILKEVRISSDPDRKLSLARGLPVYTPAVVLDSDNDNIVYLEMVGHKQAVRANWAALAAKKVRWIGGQRVYLDGMKEHVLVRASLPCGWVDYILIHKQASIREMNPEAPFFLLDDGRQPIPPLFYPMLNNCLAVPVLAEWAGYLWENGRARRLITLLNKGEGQGYAAWRVLPAPDEWQKVVQDGLKSNK
ncbi:MAG TPA: hypothetical protein ENK32_07195, partial [Anaerolineae bacterium]|nr:hypothetical protein [Anaerolineae bacterium]